MPACASDFGRVNATLFSDAPCPWPGRRKVPDPASGPPVKNVSPCRERTWAHPALAILSEHTPHLWLIGRSRGCVMAGYWFRHGVALILLAVLLATAGPMRARAQAGNDLAALREQSRQLHSEGKFTE